MYILDEEEKHRDLAALSQKKNQRKSHQMKFWNVKLFFFFFLNTLAQLHERVIVLASFWSQGDWTQARPLITIASLHGVIILYRYFLIFLHQK